ncbi:hypothetical protein AB0G71_29330 [Streptomyces sp. NPDC020403]|uniref:hypothetical protein n=1 Tax=unclassified Streptomyces TaxID=2593676 RepID=UPI0033EF0024
MSVGDPLAGIAAPLRSFAGNVSGARGATQRLTTSLRQVSAAVDRIRAGAVSTGNGVRAITSPATKAAGGFRRLGTSASTAATRIRAGATKARGPVAILGTLAAGAGAFGSMTDLFGKYAPTVTKAMTAFGVALTVGSVVMTGINTAMKANPLGFVLGIVTPLVALLIDYAMNSATGQKVIQQVFASALDVFRSVWAFMAPVIKSWAKTVSEVFEGVRRTVGAVLKTLGSALRSGFEGARSSVSSATHAVTSIVKGAWNGFKGVIQPTLTWLTKTLPSAFTRVRDAMSKSLHGMGTFMSTGIQTIAGVITGPVKGLIAFANWIIDGLNHLSFNFLGKKFGVHLSKIPQLAEGGVVLPAAVPGASSVQPLSQLGRYLPARAGASATTGPAFFAGRPGVRVYQEREGSSPMTVAEDLHFLYRTAA